MGGVFAQTELAGTVPKEYGENGLAVRIVLQRHQVLVTIRVQIEREDVLAEPPGWQRLFRLEGAIAVSEQQGGDALARGGQVHLAVLVEVTARHVVGRS